MAHDPDREADGPILRLDRLCTYFDVGGGLFGGGSGDVVRAVDDVSLEVAEGEVFGLVGESGSGKTTLGRSILKLVEPTSGHVYFRGRDLVPLGSRDMRPLRRDLALIFQDPAAALNPAMTIAQGVGHPLRIHGLTSTRADTRARVAEMLERVGLSPAEAFLDVYPEDVSGGQKQRVVIARALITEPKLVVADEPVASLDMSVRARVLELMLELQRDFDLTYLFITHDLATARFMCDRLAILYLGQVVEQGPAATLFDDPAHPYTQSLLDAIPLPDPARKDRDKRLPHGEIPDAVDPPAGCRFHPRCPEAFEECGWEGRDLVDALEERWLEVDEGTFERELAMVGGSVDGIDVGRAAVRFPDGAGEQLRDWLEATGPELPTAVFSAVEHVAVERGGEVVVRFSSGPEPAPQEVRGRSVACHLHGVTTKPGGLHVGDVADG